jgi:tRNA dimethylallyltransferase
MTNNLLVILGPTASGKTKLAVQVAHWLGGEIISADSRQVYRGMDIGTGKDLSEYVVDGQTVPYRLINVVDAGEEYNLYRYQQDFHRAVAEVQARGRVPVVCGGTGLYIEAVLKNHTYLAILHPTQNLPTPQPASELCGLSRLANTCKPTPKRTCR